MHAVNFFWKKNIEILDSMHRKILQNIHAKNKIVL